MGQDLSVIFMPAEISHERILACVRSALAEVAARNLVVVIGAGPAEFPLGDAFPAFTTLTIWADLDTSLDSVAASLSALVPQGCIVLTAADHSCVGGWQQFSGGRLVADSWTEGDHYLSIASEGLARVANGSLSFVRDDDRDLLVCCLAEPTAGYCLLSTSGQVKPGRVSGRLLQRVTEDDVSGVSYACLLGGAA